MPFYPVEQLQAMSISNVLAITVDVEGPDPFIHRLQTISVAAPDQQTITMQWPITGTAEQNFLKSLTKSDSIKVFYDAKQAIKFLKRAGLEITGPYFDIQIANQLLQAGLPKQMHSMGDITRKFNATADTTAELLLKLRVAIKNELANAGLIDTAVTEFSAIRAVAEMELNGMLLNRSQWAKGRAFDSSGPDYAKHIHLLTGRIHPTYNQIGTDTGRFTCTTPSIHGVKKNYRHCFVAQPGYKLVDADYSQQELHILAEVSGDKRLIADFQRNIDIYKSIAAKMFRQPIEALVDSQRQVAKTMVLGLIYGSGASRLHSELNSRGLAVTMTRTEQLKTAFFNQYPQLNEWYREKQQSGVKEIRSLGGRRRLCETEASFTLLCNSPIQATGADILKKALAMLPDAFGDTRTKIVTCVHDEILLEAPATGADDARRILSRVMKEAGHFYVKKVPIEVDVSITDHWQ